LSAENSTVKVKESRILCNFDGTLEQVSTVAHELRTWKPHSSIADLSFYNFPYAFGLLFGTGLYAIYQKRGGAFVPDYHALLASTGEATAADLPGRFGIDLRGRAFWDDSLEIIRARIDRSCVLEPLPAPTAPTVLDGPRCFM
jgi:oligoendopeptidase F